MSITYKTIKFQPRLIPEILADRKKSTIRIAEEMHHHIYAGDTIFLLDSYQKKPFALAEITRIERKRFDEMDEENWSNAQIPEFFSAFKEMMQPFYKTNITEETIWDVIHFRITDDGQKRNLEELMEEPQTDEQVEQKK